MAGLATTRCQQDGERLSVVRAPRIVAARDTPLGVVDVIACDPSTAQREGIFFAEFLLQHTAEPFCRALVERLRELVHDEGGA